MNETIAMIKRKAELQLPPRKSSYSPGHTTRDEYQARDILLNSKWGKEWFATRDRNKMERWDIEGVDEHGLFTRMELKTRPPEKKKWDTWIIDMYKVDWLLDNHPFDANYFVNCCEGKMHLFDMNYIRNCHFRKGVGCRMQDGSFEKRDFYYVPKDMFIVDLVSGEFGGGADLNETFINFKPQ